MSADGSDQTVTVDVVIEVKCERAMKALECVSEVMEDLADDFAYRADIQRANRALRFLLKNLKVTSNVEEQ